MMKTHPGMNGVPARGADVRRIAAAGARQEHPYG